MSRVRRAFAGLLATAVAGLAVVTGGLAGAAPGLADEPAPVAPGLGIRLLDAPVALKDDPRAHAYIIDHVAPGASFTRHVAVSNGTGKPIRVDLYPAAAGIRDGAFTIGAGRAQSELTRWVTLTPASATLAAGQSVAVEVVVRVPADAAAGERYGAVVAELPAQRPAAGGVAVASRVGVRIYLDVGPGGAPASDFTVTSLTARRTADGSPAIEALVRNTGGRALDMSGTLRLDKGPGGLSAGPFPAKLGTTLAPGQSSPVTVLLDKALPAGPWHARIELQSGLLKRAAEATVTFPAEAGSAAPPVRATAVPLTRNRPVLLWIAASLILLLLLAMLALLLWRRRRDDEDDDGTPRSGVRSPVTARRAAAQ